MIPLWTIPVALATGNTLVLKPSERDPGAAMMIAELCQKAGLPGGVLNVVPGTVPTVNAICDHPSIKAISFVGGDRAGKHIYERYVYSCYSSKSRYLISLQPAVVPLGNVSKRTWELRTTPFS